MMKRLIAMLLAMLMLLSLVGCGSSADSTEAKKGFYKVCGVYYPEELGAPVLGEAVAELEVSEAAEQITTVGDAIIYLAEQPLFDQPRDVCEQFTHLISEDYDEAGLIHFEWPDNYYCIAYVLQDDVYYALDLFRLINSKSEGVSACDAELDILCKAMAEDLSNGDGQEVPTFHATAIEAKASSQQHGAPTYSYAGTTIPEGLGQPTLSDGEIDDLIAKADYAATAQAITTLADAVNYVRRAGIVFDDIVPVSNYGSFCYIKSAWQVLKDNSGQCWTMSELLHYLLKEDYEEVGYIHARTPGDGHLMAYIYHNGKYYLVNGVGYCADTWESTWFGSYPPELTLCAEDFQTIADSLTQYMRLGDQELVNFVHLIKSPGDLAFGMVGNTEIYPVGTEVIRYYGPDFAYQEASFDWQSQTYCK